MILTCPSCGTQYVVKDGAIPPEGRQVRCASCKHSWHQDPEPGSETSEAPPAPVAPPEFSRPEVTAGIAEPDAAEPEPRADEDESFTEATLIDPASGPEAEQRAYEEAVIESAGEPVAEAPTPAPAGGFRPEVPPPSVASDAPGSDVPAEDWREPPEVEAQDDEFSPFSTADDEAGPSRRSPLLTILLVVILVAAIAAAFWFLAPDAWKARLGLAAAGASPLALVTTHMDRQRLASGQEMLNVTGRVINNTGTDQDVPPLQAQLRSRSGKLVYKWTIAPPARTLPPGASASFNSTEVSVPPGGDELTISVGAPNA